MGENVVATSSTELRLGEMMMSTPPPPNQSPLPFKTSKISSRLRRNSFSEYLPTAPTISCLWSPLPSLTPFSYEPAISENPRAIETYKRIFGFVKQLVNDDKRSHPIHLSPAYAANVAKAMIHYVGRLKSKTDSALLETSEIALEAFYTLLNEVPEIQDSVASMAVTDFTTFHFDKHILDGSTSEHRTLATRFLQLLPKLSPKFEDMTAYVRRLKEVKKILAELPPLEAPGSGGLRRLSVEGHVSPQSGTFYDVEVSAVCEAFGVNVKTGLSDEEVIKRRAQYGPNELPKPKPRHWFRILLSQVLDFMVAVLLAAAIASAAVEEYKGTGTLALVIVINTVIGFVQEYKAEKALNSLMSLDVPKATVIRNGEVADIPSAELVPGDVVTLDEGDDIPADLRLVEAVNLDVIESVLTGESDAVHKHTEAIIMRQIPIGDRKNMAYMSTTVTKGRGTGIVVTTSIRTEAGKIQDNLSKAKQPPTPLQQRLAVLGRWLVFAALFLCALIIAIGLIRNRDAKEMVLIGVSLGVSVIPEGLTTVVVVTMALGVRRMAKKNAIVRRLVAVENLGSVSTICSDKTGTLTEGKMRLTDGWLVDGNQYYTVSGSGIAPQGDIKWKKDKKTALTKADVTGEFKLSIMIAALCNNSVVQPAEEEGKWDRIGDPTEIALTLAAMKVELGKKVWTKKHEFVGEIAFDSNRKRMSVVYKETKGNKHYILVKGGLESVIGLCTHVNVDGKLSEISKKDKSKIESAADFMGKDGLRVLALAYRIDEDPAKGTNWTKEKVVENNLIFNGLMGIIDPPRKEVKDAIHRCYTAGIRVVMITGDHQVTANSVAGKLGIKNTYGRAVRGVEIDLLAQEEALDTLDPFPAVFARVSPENKLQIVQSLQNNGEIVAMTGDGVNDAPAIKKSNVGIAMGISGTDITKASSSIILMDDNFDTITKAVEEGRVIYENILKFILYLLSCNSAEILIVLISIIIGEASPFTTIQILWANIIADIPPAMALGIDPPEPDVMDRPPRPPQQPILTKDSVALIFGHGVEMAMIGLGAYLYALREQNYVGDQLLHAQTSSWTTLTIVQIFHGFFARSKLMSIFKFGFFRNWWMVGAVLLSWGILTASIYIPGLNTFLELYPLDGWDWIKVAVGLGIHTVYSEILKLIIRSAMFGCCKDSAPKRFDAEAQLVEKEVGE